MKSIITLLLCILVFWSNCFGQISTKIYYGNSIKPIKARVVLLVGNGYYCSGTLISAKKVLTAGHCVMAAKTALLSKYKTRVVRFVIHPNYDIAIAKLKTKLPVKPRRVDFNSILDRGDLVTTMGYGEEEDGKTINNTTSRRKLEKTTVWVSDWLENSPVFRSKFVMTNSGACFGDSGGPALKKGKVVGVVSYGTSYVCDADNQFTGYVSTSFPSVRRFIKRKGLR